VKVDLAFRLPGTVQQTTNFTKGKGNILRLSYTAGKEIRAKAEMMKDDAWVRRKILAGYDLRFAMPPDDPDINKHMFGERGPIEAFVGGDLKTLFDYEAEVEQAKKEFPAMLKRLGLDAGSVPASKT
jgi:hypothetical protein